MNEIHLNTKDIRQMIPQIRAGDKLYLSGTVYTARDAAHLELFKLLDRGENLPFDIKNAVIYYAGPTPTQPSGQIGSFGPTTSSRMDKFSPRLLDMGLCAMIGKGGRSAEVCEAIVRNRALYLCAIGGAGALAAKCITSCEEIAFKNLGCESLKRLEINNFPLIAAIDSRGASLFAN